MNGSAASNSSCLYHGHVVHTRHEPVRHSFRYGLFLVYLDLAELDSVFARYRLWSTRRPNIAWFRRADHFGDADRPLSDCVRRMVQDRTGQLVTGPVRLLTHLRYFGYVMNPVSFYFCFDAADTRVQAVVAEVTNTPWGERHCYVLPGSGDDDVIATTHPKRFHVSPFMPMDMSYRWHITPPADSLSIRIENSRGGRRIFDAGLSLRRRPITSLNLARTLARYPFMTAQVFTAIYWQALRLRWRGAPFHPHPRHSKTPPDSMRQPGCMTETAMNEPTETPVS